MTLALSTDKLQIMKMTADSADLDQNKHLGTYKGNVEFDQGSTHLRADHAMTWGDAQNHLILAEAYGDKQGKQAHYWTLESEDKPPIHAYANSIKYNPANHKIELLGKARVEQGTNSFAAERIIYDTERQQVISSGNKQQRIVIIYHPEKKQKNELTSSNKP